MGTLPDVSEAVRKSYVDILRYCEDRIINRDVDRVSLVLESSSS